LPTSSLEIVHSFLSRLIRGWPQFHYRWIPNTFIDGLTFHPWLPVSNQQVNTLDQVVGTDQPSSLQYEWSYMIYIMENDSISSHSNEGYHHSSFGPNDHVTLSILWCKEYVIAPTQLRQGRI
jgi:hypothetical protein